MKKIIAPILLFTLAGLMAGCHTNIIDRDAIGGGDNGNEDEGGREITLTIHDRSQLDQRIAAESRVCEVAFTAHAGWFTEIPDENLLHWISVAPRYSDLTGEQTMRIFTDENTSGDERTARFTLHCAGQSETVTITQSPLLSDGTLPEPYQPDPYTDIISRICVRDLQNQLPGAPSFEWRFGFDEQQCRVFHAEYVLLTGEQEFQIDNYNFPDNRMIEHYAFDIDGSGVSSTVRIQESIEITVNDYGHILDLAARVFDNGSGNPEPSEYRTLYRYSDYRLAAAQTGDRNVGFAWKDGNRGRYSEQDGEATYTYVYNDRRNDRTNIDLNALLTNDLYGAVGLFGKRSRNLLLSRTHVKGLQDTFEYTFDAAGRVKTIMHNTLYEGVIQPVFLYTVYYENDTNTFQ